jgi:hypothetical protein
MSDFQARSSGQGRYFEDIIEGMLKFSGWTIDGVRVVVAPGFPSVDIVATDPEGAQWWIECKGADGHSQRQPGCRDGTTVKVAVGVAAALFTLPNRLPYRLITSHLPKEGSVGAQMLDIASEQGWFSAIDVLPGFASVGGMQDISPVEDEDDM